MATLTTTPIKVFVSGETVTPTKLNELSQSTVALTAGTIVDADVSASAAIAMSKLATGALPTAITVASANLVDGTIVDADVSATAAVALSKLGTGALPAAITVATANIVDANVTPAKLSQPYTLATAQNSTSGTSIDFTGIPSWAKRITVMFDGVSTNGTSAKLIQLGDAGGFETTGYLGGSQLVQGVTGFSGVYSTAGIPINSVSAADSLAGAVTFSILSQSNNTWVAQGVVRSNGLETAYIGGSKSLSDTLTQVRVTTVNGTNTFDAGTINIAYEG